jgi:hypothetical protein
MPTEPAAKPNDRVVFRDAFGADAHGRILSINADNEARIALDNGVTVENVEFFDPTISGMMFLHSWRLIASTPMAPQREGIWVEALAAGIVTVLLELESGGIPVGKDMGRALLASFRHGVELVIEIGWEKPGDGA